MQRILKFHLTTHVQRRMAERGITVVELKDVVNYSQTKTAQYKGDHGGVVFRFSKVRGKDTVTVVAEIKGSECWLITGWL